MKLILRDDESGQFILLMSIIVAIGLVIILIFFNQSMMAGHSSAQSIMDFPKDDIRDFRTKTVNEAIYLGSGANAGINATKDDSATAFYGRFNDSFDRYLRQLQDIYAREGTSVSGDYSINLTEVPAPGNKILHPCDNMTIKLYYTNGETSYDYNSTVYLD